MAKKIVKDQEAPAQEAPAQETAPAQTHEMITLENLMGGRVHVTDSAGNEFYLDPARKQGEFILRVVSKPVIESTESIPGEWIKPTAEEIKSASTAIDWGMEEKQPEEEGGENV